jgi:hypothetical protein
MSQNNSSASIPVVLMPGNVGEMTLDEIRDHLDQHYQALAAEEQFPEESSLSEDDPHYSPTWKCE